ncbi:TonB-dependent receptor [Algibacter pectinivorans]|uniref:TonB-dependent Receptor Plug Domain n=1 Tax=Algibacter pectinivorans TaxID=870482 RepID=A0A1I1PMP5_9FLAO|nr:TonB-dependent receptor [Algibacter pectinivorans]SFD11025.1 TonB-dependent Receptor Plug Domain [Algibacter pectinivorans]
MNHFKYLFYFLLTTNSFLLPAQNIVSGKIKDTNNKPIIGANIILNTEPNSFSTTDLAGNFSLLNVPDGSFTITVSHIGFKTIDQLITVNSNNKDFNFTLNTDVLNLHTVVVTGNFAPKTQLESSTSVTTLNTTSIKQVYPQGTANLLQNIPGTFTDASAGEVFTRVYTRGVSAAAEDDMGWYYVSLQEDGLPVSLVQHSYYAPDLFHRVDLTTSRVEALRGGSASITAMNAPGGIYNFISRTTSKKLNGEIQLQNGVQVEGNPFYRADAVLGSGFGNHWYFNAGGHYRHNDGARNTDFTFSKGGQFKFDVKKENSRGYFKLYGKYLNDYTNRYNGVAATNWNNPEAAFGQNFNSTALLMPEFNTAIPDGRNLNSTNSFNPANGVHAKDLAFGFDMFQNLGNNWSVKNNMKFSTKNANWQTSISNAFVSISDPTVYYLVSNGNPFPVGQIVFNDANSGNEVARIDNSGIFSGNPSEYLTDGRLPNDAVMGTSTWYKDNDADEFMQQLTLRKEWDNHDLNFGFATGFSNTSVFTQGSFVFSTYENNPKMLQVTLENPGDPVVALSDAYGISNYGGLFFTNSRAKISQIATFANDRWKLSDKLNLDLGLRFESITHKGSNDRFAPFTQDGGLDGDETTAYDNNILAPTGQRDNFNFNYNYVSYSVGLNYKLTDDASLFGRLSQGNKAPELNYYFNNFANVPINKAGEIQNINQVEIGLKSAVKSFSFTSTLFWSELKNIGVSNFEFDDESSSIFYTPIQFNSSRTLGLEWETSYNPISHLTFRFNGILQDPKATNWNVYDAAGTVDVSDDSTTDYSGNTLAFNPKLMFNVAAEFSKNKVSSFLKWKYTGKREGNIANAFQLDAYKVFDAGFGYKISQRISANLLVTNLFNSDGLANFYGANTFGANANGVTTEYINENPDASFVVVPILPRSTLLQLNYKF